MITPNGIYIADLAGRVYGFDRFGELSWRQEPITTSLLNPLLYVDANTLVATEQGTELFGLNITDGSKKWTFNANTTIERMASIGPKRRVYLATSMGQLYALSPDTGKMQWVFFTDGLLPDVPPVFNLDGSVFVGTLNGSVHALDRNGFQLWTFKGGLPFDFGVTSSPDGLIYAVSRDSNLTALDENRGTIIWHQNLTDTLALPLVVGSDGVLYAILANGEIQAWDSSGELLWKKALPAGFKVQDRALDNHGRLQITSQNGSLIEIQTGSKGPWAVDFKEGTI